MKVLRKAIEKYIIKYNTRRLHSAIGYQAPNVPQEHFLASSRQVYYQAANNLDPKGEKALPKVS